MMKIILVGLISFTFLWTLVRCANTNSYYAPSGGRSSYGTFQGGGPSRGK
ncbi:hypothetical protein NIES267_34160 [Calothrix parasitica NIES-267]|uniref:Uncharacterized protein n=1 Tax=Calothrix parasitica NIES-267 TaxID=1973488 RepID=A0A1Z4LRP4_9CYAN|nr:hypothetical protein NIES267_34160 [Calothrix parasitica NIES-267]